MIPHTFSIIPFIPDLWILIPAATYGWGYFKGAKRKRLPRGM